VQRVRNQAEASSIQRLQSNFGLAFQLFEQRGALVRLRRTFRDQPPCPASPRPTCSASPDYSRHHRTVATLVRPTKPATGGTTDARATAVRSLLLAFVPAAAQQPGQIRVPDSGLQIAPLRFNPPQPKKVTLSNKVVVYLLETTAALISVQLVSRVGVATSRLAVGRGGRPTVCSAPEAPRSSPDSVDKLSTSTRSTWLLTDHEQSTAALSGLSRYTDSCSARF